MVLRGIISKKIPVIKELGVFYQSWYCKDHGNQGSDNQGPALPKSLKVSIWVANGLRKILGRVLDHFIIFIVFIIESISL